MSEWTVFFNQINRTAINVKSKGKLNAIAKAERIWRREYGIPECVAIQPVLSQHVPVSQNDKPQASEK